MPLRNLLLATASIAACAISVPCQATSIPADEVDVFVGNNEGMPDSTGAAMFANFTPPGGLAETAAKMGFIGFDWTQTITNWPNPDLRNHNGQLIVPVPPDSAFLDPPVGGYNYNPCGGKPSGASGGANPFYFNPTPSTDCWSLSQNETETTLSFGDEPMDHELTAKQISENDIPKFTTELVGIEPGDILGPVLFFWTWETDYDGEASTNAAISSRSANSPELQPGLGGTGHVTILSIDGVPVPVPEPPALFLLASAVAAILTARKAAFRNKDR
jgi:hypothetical protein